MVIIIKTIIGNVVIALPTNLATNYAEINFTVNACYLHCTHTSMIFAAPSAIASGQPYRPDDGAYRYNFAIWYRRLQTQMMCTWLDIC